MGINKNSKILIVGTGLIGGSYAQGLTEAGFEVGGVDSEYHNRPLPKDNRAVIVLDPW